MNLHTKGCCFLFTMYVRIPGLHLKFSTEQAALWNEKTLESGWLRFYHILQSYYCDWDFVNAREVFHFVHTSHSFEKFLLKASAFEKSQKKCLEKKPTAHSITESTRYVARYFCTINQIGLKHWINRVYSGCMCTVKKFPNFSTNRLKATFPLTFFF